MKKKPGVFPGSGTGLPKGYLWEQLCWEENGSVMRGRKSILQGSVSLHVPGLKPGRAFATEREKFQIYECSEARLGRECGFGWKHTCLRAALWKKGCCWGIPSLHTRTSRSCERRLFSSPLNYLVYILSKFPFSSLCLLFGVYNKRKGYQAIVCNPSSLL